MQEGDAKAVYIVEPISRNHKNHINHPPSLSSVFVDRRRDLYTYSYNFWMTYIETVLRGVDSLSGTRYLL
jgi:hypothetical protein